MIRHVLILGLDGAGAYVKDAKTPRIDQLMERGAKTYLGRTVSPCISAECWGALLLGVSPDKHGLTNNHIRGMKNVRMGTQQYPSLFAVAREQMPEAALGSFCDWWPINNGIVEHDVGVFMGTGKTEIVTASIISFFQASPALVFAHYDWPDHIGGKFGWGSPEYYDSITAMDAEVGKIVDALAAQEILEETLIIIAADHGGINFGHGGDTDEEMNIFIGIAGVGIQHMNLDGMRILDIPPVVARALSLKPPTTWEGHVPDGLFGA